MQTSGTPGRVTGLIDQTVRELCPGQPRKQTARFCYISHSLLSERGIHVSCSDVNRPILILGGTSIQFTECRELIEYLLESGYEVASIEHPVGGPFDFCLNPVKERPYSLEKTLNCLKAHNVQQVDIVAQSYAIFEVIRTLLKDSTYRGFVRNIVLINPPGLDKNINMVKHIDRFLMHHLFKGFIKSIGLLFGFRNMPIRSGMNLNKEFALREIKGIGLWSFKTLQNIVRTFREVKDIVTFLICEPLMRLQECGYTIRFFLQSEDQLIPMRRSLKTIYQTFPQQSVKIAPGGHNDLFFQKWQRSTFLEFLKEIRSSSEFNNSRQA